MSVNEQVLDAIELLMNNSIQQAGYDKTIQAQIVSCQDPSIGKYKCKYQDALIYAYATNPDINFSKGTNVYILVPENNMSKDKTILGTVDKLGVDYISMAVGEQAYNIIGSNVLSNSAAAFYLDVDIANYSNNIYDIDQGTDQVGLNITELNEYIKQASSILIGATIQTTIPQEQQKQGDYGIKFTLQFKDERGNIGIDREYILDVDKMIDNPYNLVNPTRQYAIFDIDSQNFIRVKKITIFNKNFPSRSDVDSDSPYEITLTNLEFECAARMAEEELNGLGLSIITPRGLIFTNSLDQDKILQAQVKFKGRVVPAANVSFYWGTQDLQITPQKDRYNKYLGRGWYCINNYNEIQSEEGARSIQWVSYGDTYQVPFNLAKVRDNRIKVAVVYDGNVITKQINIQNLTNSAGVITIESSNGTEFHYGIGQTLLSCSISNNISYQGTLTYAWGWQNGGKDLQQLPSTSSTTTVEAKYITNFAIYKCSVYDLQGIIGTGLIKLTNSMQEGNINPLMIENGIVLYKYNEKGISPTSRTLQNPQIIEVLKFKLYDDVGQQIEVFHSGLIDSRANVKWRVPINNTLLKLPDPPLTTEDGYYIIQNTQTLTYDLEQRYDVRKNINQIILQVTYNGVVSIAQTNLTFTKQGQIGTNGTDYYVEILPNTIMANPPLFPMITKFSNGNYKLNYGLDAYDDYTINPNLSLKPLLKVQFLHGGEPVSSGYTVKWKVLKNYYGTQNSLPVEDESDFTINQSTGIMTYTGNLALNDARPRANIIECEITYDGHTYYSAIPFITAYMVDSNHTFDLVDGTGFHYVVYSSEGMQPEYSSLPFEFTDGNNGTCTVLGNIQVKNGSTWISQNSGDLVQNNQDQFKIQPIGFYKGECVNNSVRYKVNNIGIINIPIHFYLNRYNFAHLNGWDGNSIQINEEDGYILAPQMGAGKKEDDNSFTGVLLGEVKNPGTSSSKIGLLGYNQGEETFFLNSQTGDVRMVGSLKAGPRSGSGNNVHYNFEVDNTVGSSGILVKAGYDFASNDYNFKITQDGNVFLIGDLKAGTKSGIRYNFEVDKSTGAISAGYDVSGSTYRFNVDQNGYISSGWNGNQYMFTTNNTGVTVKGEIVANSGKIGGINGWTIGSAAASGSDPARGYIYSGSRTSLDSTASGLYIGTDGISAYKSGTGITFKVDSSGNVMINGDITLGSGSSISWGQVTNKPVVATISEDSSGNYTLQNQSGTISAIVPEYIKSTYIDSTRIESPTIYAGQYYATGQGYNNGAAYYIYNGYNSSTQTLGTEIGYISYDTHGAGTTEQAANRVLFTTLNDTALKLYSGGNMSLEAGITNIGYFNTIYMGSDVLFSGNIRLKAVQYWGGLNYEYHGTYGTSDPVTAFGNNVSTGQLYFKIVS